MTDWRPPTDRFTFVRWLDFGHGPVAEFAERWDDGEPVRMDRRAIEERRGNRARDGRDTIIEDRLLRLWPEKLDDLSPNVAK